MTPGISDRLLYLFTVDACGMMFATDMFPKIIESLGLIGNDGVEHGAKMTVKRVLPRVCLCTKGDSREPFERGQEGSLVSQY